MENAPIGRDSPWPKLRWGILATGWIADLFVQDLLDNDMEVTAVGSRSIEKAVDFATKHGIPRSHGSYEALAAPIRMSMFVYIATPHPFHAAAAAELCIAAGKHVLVEKSLHIDRAPKPGICLHCPASTMSSSWRPCGRGSCPIWSGCARYWPVA